MIRYFIELRTKKYTKEYGLLPFARNQFDKHGKKLLNTARKTGLNAAKTVFKKVVHKTAEATGEFIWNKIAQKVVKTNPVPDVNSKIFGKAVILPEKRQEMLNALRLVL